MNTADPLCLLSLDVLVLGVHRGLLCYAGGFQESMLLVSGDRDVHQVSPQVLE